MNYYGPFLLNSALDLGLLILRVTFGFSMILGHGWGKFTRVFSGDLSFGDPIGIGPELSLILVTFAEFFCSILLICGWFTRWILVPLILVMLVALIMVHWSDPFARQEKIIMYLAAYLTIFLMGPGTYSLDFYRQKP